MFCLESSSDHAQDLAWTYKIFQERGRFTDMTFICEGGDKISAHGMMVLRHCPQLRMFFAKFSCCYCHGTDCGGCDRKDNIMTVSLPDFKKSTLVSFLELLYTGRTFFTTNSDYEKVVDLGKQLGFSLPASGLSLVQSEEITQPPARPRNKRISSSIQQQQQPSSSTPNPKRARVIDTTIEDHDPNISEVNSPQNVSSINTPNAGYSNQHPCEKCQKLFPSKYLMKKHSKDCLGPNSQEPIEGKSKCDGCGEYFTTQGGWLTRHLTKCPGSNQQQLSTPVVTTPVPVPAPQVETRKTKECARCGKVLLIIGGVYARHIAKCQVSITDTSTPVSTTTPTKASTSVSAAEEKNCQYCPKCNKQYLPHVKRFFDSHVRNCRGIKMEHQLSQSLPATATAELNTTTSILSEPQPIISEEPNNIDEVMPDISAYENMYKTGEWNCFMCSKWFARRSYLQQHLLVHYKLDIKNQYISDVHMTKCPLCDFEGKDLKSLISHIAVKPHYKLKEYIPDFAKDLIFGEINQSGVNISKQEPKEYLCCVCKQKFDERYQLTDHIVDHFSNQILDKYVESGTKCKICRYHDANLNQLTRHVALQHEKIREFIPKEEGDALFTINKDLATTNNELNSQISNNSLNNSQTTENTTTIMHNNQVDHVSPVVVSSLPFVCHICSKGIRTRSELRQHVFTHVRDKIQSKYYPDNVIKNCLECNYKSSEQHVLMHLALKHQKIIEFVPQEVSELFYPIGATTTATEDSRKNSTDNNELAVVHRKICKKDKKSTENSPVKASPGGGGASTNNHVKGEPLNCPLCHRECKHFHYLKGHISMHFRQKLKEKVLNWGGGLGGTGFACRICHFVAKNLESLVTHTGYKHSLFYEFMSEDMQKEYRDIADKVGEKLCFDEVFNIPVPVPVVVEEEPAEVEEEEEFSCPKCKSTFTTQLELASHMTNVNCKPIMTPKCLLCDIEIGSHMLYKSHLVAHYFAPLENAVKDIFRENEGICQQCNNDHPGGNNKPLELNEFIKHWAVDHDNILNVISSEVKTHFNLVFPNSTNSKIVDDDIDNVKENEKMETFESIHIEIEAVEEEEENTEPEVNNQMTGSQLPVVEEEEMSNENQPPATILVATNEESKQIADDHNDIHQNDITEPNNDVNKQLIGSELTKNELPEIEKVVEKSVDEDKNVSLMEN